MRKCAALLLSLCLSSTASHAAQTVSQSLGKKTYELACVRCHAPNVSEALKAPAAFDKEAWSARFKAAKEQLKHSDKFADEYAYLVHQVKIGKGLMHHHGLCLESMQDEKVCHDAAYVEAIKYMAQIDD